MVGSITFPTGIAANDVVRLFNVPAGARIVAFHLHKTGTASFSVALGTSTTSDRFSAAASLGSSDPSAALVASRDPAPLAADTLVQAEITGSPAANQVLTVTAFYLAP
ncbi:MAG: hypothetical protein NZL87_04550 [Thermomicrobium sp.]|nr:hypothetical protein [Thermomicrobium sp.]